MDTIRLLKDILAPFTEQKGMGVIQNGGANCEFGHFHFHVFPRFENDGYDWIYPIGKKEVSKKVAERINRSDVTPRHVQKTEKE